MGVDIHMYICKEKKIIAEDIFDGRNSEWFANLQNEGWDDEYSHLPNEYGFGNHAPEEIINKYSNEIGYYGFYHMNVKDFMEWFQKYQPDKDAGWVSTYDKWRMENKEYIPEELYHELPKDARIEDMHFVEFIKPYDCSKWLYYYLVNNKIDKEADIVYFFDH